MTDDSSLLTAAGDEPGSGGGDLREGPHGCLNGNHRREQLVVVQTTRGIQLTSRVQRVSRKPSEIAPELFCTLSLYNNLSCNSGY